MSVAVQPTISNRPGASVTSGSPRSQKGSLTDRVHKAKTNVKDTRQRRNSFLVAGGAVGGAGDDLEVPEILTTINRIARVFTVGCSRPKQSLFHQRLISCLLSLMFAASIFIVDKSRRNGNISLFAELGIFCIFLTLGLSYRFTREDLPFDNVLCRMHARTIQILTKGRRPDLVERTDALLRTGVVRRFMVMPVVIALMAYPLIILSLCRGMGPLENITVCATITVFHTTSMVWSGGWYIASQLHALQIEMLQDELTVAFDDLSKSKEKAETARASGHSTKLLEAITGQGRKGEDARELLVAESEFFDEDWVMQMTIAYIDIGKSMAVTSSHGGMAAARLIAAFVASAGLLGLSMLFTEITIDVLFVVIVCLALVIQPLAIPLVANDALKNLQNLAFECYEELMAHNLIYKHDEENLAGIKYKQTVNAAAHFLNIVQTSSNIGIMFGSVRFSADHIKKLLHVSFSASVVVLRTGNLSSITAVFVGGGGNSTAVVSS